MKSTTPSSQQPPVVSSVVPGTITTAKVIAAESKRPSSVEKNTLLGSRGLILGLLFGVTAALGLPLLWMSSAFSHKEKLVWSAVIVAYTVLLCAITYAAIRFALSALNLNPVFY